MRFEGNTTKTNKCLSVPCEAIVALVALDNTAADAVYAMNTVHDNNAVAGPSTPRSSSKPPSPSSPSSFSSTANLFLPPPPPPKTQSVHLSSTQDLLGRFHLLPAYDKYVRPFAAPTETGLDQLGPTPATPGTNGMGVDKGKAKEFEGSGGGPGLGLVTPVAVAQDGGDGDDEEGGKDKKQRNNYKHLIKGIPGKHSLKKDDYLTKMMLVPPKQRIQIAPFDGRTQREAFTVSLEGLKGWNPTVLVLESAQAREDRKKRKEAKRLQKLQAQAALAHPQPQSQSQPIPAPAPTPASATSPSFPRPSHVHPHQNTQNSISNGTPRPGSTAPLARPTPVVATASGVPPPTQRPGSAVPRPGSAVPRPGSAVPRPTAKPPIQIPTATPRVATPLRSATTTTATPTSANPYQTAIVDDKRGLKRERDDLVVSSNGLGHVNGHGNGYGNAGVIGNGNGQGNGQGNVGMGAANLNAGVAKPVINAKAGTAGIRPRPLKKQRMDMQGQARDVTVTQQPTPQGF